MQIRLRSNFNTNKSNDTMELMRYNEKLPYKYV